MKIRRSTRKDIRGMLAVAGRLTDWPQPLATELGYEHGFVAMAGNRMIGFVSVTHEEGLPVITYLRVDPARTRQGAGTKLVAAVLDEAKSLGAARVRVQAIGWTRPFNRMYAETLKFYEAQGFRVVKKHPVVVEEADRWRLYTLEKAL